MSSNHPLSGRAAITGLGMTELGRVYGRSATDFAVDAVRRAAADAGLAVDEIDGLLLNAGISQGIDLSLAQAIGLRELARAHADERLRLERRADGRLRGDGRAARASRKHVACVFADAPLVPGKRAGAGVRRRARRAAAASGRSRRRSASSARSRSTRCTRSDTWICTARRRTSSARSRVGVARLGAERIRTRTMREPLDLAGLPRVALDRRAVPRARLLPGLERRDLRDRERGRARARSAPSRRCTCGASRQAHRSSGTTRRPSLAQR